MSTEKNKRLAELLGWETEGYRYGYGGPPDETAPTPIPSYSTDLNAVQAVWNGLARYQKSITFSHLQDLKDSQDRGCPTWEVMDTTAEQRVDALIKTLEAKE